MSKRTGIIIIILILLIAIVIGLISFNNNDIQENEYQGAIDLEYVKQVISENEYYEFEDNGEKYILFKIVESVYVPDSILIESAEILNKEYSEDNKLNVNIDVRTDITRGQSGTKLPEGGKTKDSRYFTLKIEDSFTGLNVNNEEYNRFSGGIVQDASTEKYGYINGEGVITIPVEYDEITEFENHYYNEETDEQIEIDYNNYLKIYKEDLGMGIAKKDGNILIDCTYSSILNFGENTFAVTTGTEQQAKLGVIDINGNLIKDYINGGIFDDSKVFNKYAVISLNGKKGIVNRNLEILVPMEYDDMKIETSETTTESGISETYYFIGNNNDAYTIADEEGNIKMDSESSVNDLIEQYESNGYDANSILGGLIN